MSEGAGERAGERLDLRLLLVAAAAWAGALVGVTTAGPTAFLVALAAAALGLLAVRAGRRHARWVSWCRAAAVSGLVLAALATTAALREAQVGADPVADLAAERAVVGAQAVVTSDVRTVQGRFGEQALVRVSVREVSGRGQAWRTRTPVLVLGEPRDLAGVRLGSRIALTGRLGPADGEGLAGLLHPSRRARVLQAPGPAWRVAEVVRAGIRDAVAHRPPEQAALVPALVDGDDAAVSESLAADFRTAGLTHLLAVSGTNLTLLVGFVLVLARWCGVRGRWLVLVAALGIAGFVVLARTEPSVLRAAVMGGVGLVGLGSGGRRRGPRALAVAVVLLLLVQPGLARMPGFALSVLATAGIVLLAPAWRDALVRWTPRWLAEAVAVPAAAQLACTPVVAALSGQVSLVAVVANLLVAPVVGPATVLGLAAGLVHLVWAPVGRLVGTGAGWCVAWVVAVARRSADLPTAAVVWGTTPLALAGLTVLVLVVAVVGPLLLRRRTSGLACAVLALGVLLVRLPSPGWAPEGWRVVACDVGQGDALVLDAGGGTAVVVDAGPDPAPVDACLHRLGVQRLAAVLLTHFHADHVDGLPGVLVGRRVDRVDTTGLADPPAAVEAVVAEARGAGVVPHVVGAGDTLAVGRVRLQVLWPREHAVRAGPGDGSTANDASLAVLADVDGLRVLLTGDLEPDAQAALARSVPDLRVDVLKMPHHGSRHQDEAWLTSLDADVVLVSVGADNDYGHPAASALEPLAAAGAAVGRTDTQGDLAVVVEGGEAVLRTRR